MVKHAASQKRNYDIVFMDHMMPEMDGIEAAAIIRAWEKECADKNGYCEPSVRHKQIPIVALTANAVVGMREMFLENGFNDFLDKPIDVGKLDEILDRWISKEKKESGSGELGVGNTEHLSNNDNASSLQYPDSSNRHFLLPTISGLDTEHGIKMSGGTLGAYRDVLAFFRKDAQERLPLLQTAPNADALVAFVTQVHALKSASASIGAAELSAQAAALESAGKAGDIAFIQENLGAFAKCLSELAEGIWDWEKNVKEHNSEKQVTAGDLDHTKVTSLLHELAQALKSQKGDVIDRILEQITQKPLNSGVKTAIGQIADEVLIAEYEKALGILDNLLKGEN
jgi:CheY-like chemotaxis protein